MTRSLTSINVYLVRPQANYSQRGIEIDPSKLKAITEMLAPRIKKEVNGFLGRLNYIGRFIGKLTTTCESLFKLLKKNEPMVWNNDCQIFFKKISAEPSCLSVSNVRSSSHHVLGSPRDFSGLRTKPHDESGRKELAIYYFNKKFGNHESPIFYLGETCYANVENLPLHVVPHHPLVSRMDLLKYLFEKSPLSGRLARWQLLLAEFDITMSHRNR